MRTVMWWMSNSRILADCSLVRRSTRSWNIYAAEKRIWKLNLMNYFISEDFFFFFNFDHLCAVVIILWKNCMKTAYYHGVIEINRYSLKSTLWFRKKLLRDYQPWDFDSESDLRRTVCPKWAHTQPISQKLLNELEKCIRSIFATFC